MELTAIMTIAVVGTALAGLLLVAVWLLWRRSSIVHAAREVVWTPEGAMTASELAWSVRSLSESPHVSAILASRAQSAHEVVAVIQETVDALPEGHQEEIRQNIELLQSSRAIRQVFTEATEASRHSNLTVLADALAISIVTAVGPEKLAGIAGDLLEYGVNSLPALEVMSLVDPDGADSIGEAVGGVGESVADHIIEAVPGPVPVFALARLVNNARDGQKAGLEGNRIAENAGWDLGAAGGVALGGTLGSAVLPILGTAIGALVGGAVGGAIAKWGKGRHLLAAQEALRAEMTTLGSSLRSSDFGEVEAESLRAVRVKRQHLELFSNEFAIHKRRPASWWWPTIADIVCADVISVARADLDLETEMHHSLVHGLRETEAGPAMAKGVAWVLTKQHFPDTLSGPDLTEHLPAVERLVEERRLLSLTT